MAKGIIISGGNGGDGSDDCTATTSQVLEGYKAITSDSDDEVANGTMKDLSTRATITHSSSNSTKVIIGDAAFVSTNNDGTTRAEIRYNGNEGLIRGNTLFAIPQATMATAGSLTADKLLAGQSAFGISGTATSDATATDGYVYSGKTYYRNGVKGTGSMTVSSVVSFSVAAYSTSQVLCTWKNPAKGPYGGVIIRYKTGSYPTSVTDGTQGYKGIGTNSAVNGTSTATIGSLAAGTTYYFRIWMYCDSSAGTMYSGYKEASAKVTSHGSKAFTTSGTWTVPSGVRSARAFLVGGGGGGRAGYTTKSAASGAGGGGGMTKTTDWTAVTPGATMAVVVGAGGDPANGIDITDGGSSSALGVTVGGGWSGKGSSIGSDGGDGGSGGGRAASTSGDRTCGGKGGSDGSNGHYSGKELGGGGVIADDKPPAGRNSRGQHSTTKTWGVSNGTLYSGGGGGGSHNATSDAPGGDGGGGRAGRPAVAGGTNTGGGGGGGGRYLTNKSSAAGKGGTGIVIIEW